MKVNLVIIFFSILLSSLGYGQQMDPVCLRLEGIMLPCLSGGLKDKPEIPDPGPTCYGGEFVEDQAACDAKVCEVNEIVIGDYSYDKRGNCESYSLQCSGSYSADGCEISCNLQGNSCVANKVGNCGGVGSPCGSPNQGACNSWSTICESRTNTECSTGAKETLPPGSATMDENKCCKCPRSKYAPRCGNRCS